MANVAKIQEYGNQLKVIYDDGNTDLAYPTQGGLWVVSQGGGPGPGPGTPDYMWPFSLDLVTSEFRPPDRPTHNGMDFSGGPATEGKPMPACAAGVVWLAGSYYGYGNAVIIDHGTLDDHNVKTLYGHQQRLYVNAGDVVAQAQTIGLVGNTGESFGAHLHFEVWIDGASTAAAINPRTFMATYNPTNNFIYG